MFFSFDCCCKIYGCIGVLKFEMLSLIIDRFELCLTSGQETEFLVKLHTIRFFVYDCHSGV